MAIDGSAYGIKEFEFAIKPEAVIGTALETMMQLLNIDDLPEADYNPALNTEPRHGVGRTMKFLDNYISVNGRLKTIPIAGVADTTTFKLLLSNVLSIAIDTAPASFDLPADYTPPAMLTGDGGDITKTMTAALISPLDTDSVIFPGCLCSHLNLKFSAFGDDDNRGMFTADLVTQFLHSTGQAAPTGMDTYGQGFYNLSQFATKRDFAGGSDVIIEGLEIDIVNPVKFEGASSSNGDPESISRGLPYPKVIVTATLKMDTNAPSRFVTGSSVTIELSNNVTWASATGFGFKSAKGVIISVTKNDRSSVYQDIAVEVQADTTGDMFQFIA